MWKKSVSLEERKGGDVECILDVQRGVNDMRLTSRMGKVRSRVCGPGMGRVFGRAGIVSLDGEGCGGSVCGGVGGGASGMMRSFWRACCHEEGRVWRRFWRRC